jgi:hypothetical protein
MAMRNLMAVAALVVAGVSAIGGAQESSLRAERAFDFRFGRAMDIKATVGPVRVSSVEFTDLGKGYGQGGLAGRLRAASPGVNASEASTMVRAHFLAENPQSDEWEVAFTLEFLDKAGALVDRVTKRSTWEGEAKPYDLDHQMLTYVVPMIARVRIKMEGRLD